MRLLIICNDIDYFLAHRWPLFADLRDVPATATVLCGGKWEGRVLPAADNVVFEAISCERFRFSFYNDLRMILALLLAMWRIRPEIVNTITIKPNLYGGLIVLLYRLLMGSPVKLVMMWPGLGRVFAKRPKGAWGRLKLKAIQLSLWISMRQKDAVSIFENYDDRRQWVARSISPRGRTRVLAGAGVTLQRWPEKVAHRNSMLRVLFASRLIRTKGIEVFIEAARIAAEQGLDIEFVIAGQSDPRDPDNYLIKPDALPANTTYCGFVKHMDILLASVDVICLPTVYGEGIPRILLEGAAMRRCLVATGIAGCRRIIQHGKSGLLIDPRDGSPDPNDLVEAFSHLLLHPEDISRMSVNAHRHLHGGGFHLEAVAAHHRKILFA